MSNNIKIFQLQNNLKVDGIVNSETSLFIGNKLSLGTKELVNFLAQIDSICDFKAKRENTNFSKFKINNHFEGLFDSKQIIMYSNNPIAIANRCYANKYGNGNEASGDGFKFRGNGFLKVIGRTHHQEFSNFIGDDCLADTNLIIDKYLFENTKFLFDKHDLWKDMRKVDSDSIINLSQKVNKIFNVENVILKNIERRISKTLIYDKTI